MALFKIFKGLSGNLAQVEKHEGYCYFTPDTNKFYIDIDNNTRVPLNAETANKLWVSIIDSSTGDCWEKEATLETILTADEDKIPTSKAVMTYLATIETQIGLLGNDKMDKENPTGFGSFSLNRADNSEIGEYSFAEGYNNIASGGSSHAEGFYTIAIGEGSHVEGTNTITYGRSSHAEGMLTEAHGSFQHVEGKANIADDADQYVHIVGNGEEEARSNAHTLDWEGNAWYSGDVYVSSTSGINKDEGSKKLATEEYADSQIIQVKTTLEANSEINTTICPINDIQNYDIQIDLDCSSVKTNTASAFNLKKKYINAQLTGETSYDSASESYILTIAGTPQTESLPLTITYFKIN